MAFFDSHSIINIIIIIISFNPDYVKTITVNLKVKTENAFPPVLSKIGFYKNIQLYYLTGWFISIKLSCQNLKNCSNTFLLHVTGKLTSHLYEPPLLTLTIVWHLFVLQRKTEKFYVENKVIKMVVIEYWAIWTVYKSDCARWNKILHDFIFQYIIWFVAFENWFLLIGKCNFVKLHFIFFIWNLI